MPDCFGETHETSIHEWLGMCFMHVGWCRGEQHTEAWSCAGCSLVARASSKRAYHLFCWKNQELMLHTNSTCR